MTLSLDKAYDELRAALAGAEDDVFYDVIAISDRLLRSKHPDPALIAWAESAARGVLARNIPPDKLVCYDTLDARLSALIFSISDSELDKFWPALPLSNLRMIKLGKADIDWKEMPDCNWPLLKDVSVYEGPGVANGVLVWLARQDLPALREFSMPGVEATNADFGALSCSTYWAQLENVDVGYNTYLGGPWRALPAARSLKLPNTHATADDLRTLLSVPLPQLAHLDISGNRIENAGFDVLIQRPLPALTTLGARACNFEHGHAWRVLAHAQLPSLRRLDLQDSLRDPRSLAAAAPVLRGLTELKLGSCELDDAGAAVLASLEMPVLEHLDLTYNQLTDQGIAHLATARWPCLKHFDISVNPLGDRGVAALTEAPWWAALEEIGLVRVEVTDAGLGTLTRAIPRALRKLSVGPAKWFGDDAYQVLRNALPDGALF